MKSWEEHLRSIRQCSAVQLMDNRGRKYIGLPTTTILDYVVGSSSRCGGRDRFSSGVMDHDCCPAIREETVMTTQRTRPPHPHETTSSAIDYRRSSFWHRVGDPLPFSCNFNSLGLFHGVRRVVTRFPCCCFLFFFFILAAARLSWAAGKLILLPVRIRRRNFYFILFLKLRVGIALGRNEKFSQ